MFLSTSPNLPMVASLDVARKQMATEGDGAAVAHDRSRARDPRAPERHRGAVLLRRGAARAQRRLRSRSDEDRGDGKGLGYTGYEASEILRRRYNIQVELADLFNVVALFTIGTTRDAAERFVAAFQEMARDERELDMFAPSGILEQRLRRRNFSSSAQSLRCGCDRAKRFLPTRNS